MTMSKREVWLVNLDPTIGDEICKVRPAVIMSRDTLRTLALRVIVPITGWQPKFQGCNWLVRIDPDAANGLDKPSVADTFQVRSVATKRLVRRLGQLASQDISRVTDGLKAVLEA